jgi:cellulose synthase/poly-beta-1,6-N-acetylglucosamine synthase-like glycosyltransferase
MTLIFILLFFLYFLFLALMSYAWQRILRDSPNPIGSGRSTVSIVIAARNESANVGALLEDIINQRHANFKAIVVDDHSDDGTINIVRNFAARDPRISATTNVGEGKKAALTTGIKLSDAEIIVTTDADCRVETHWLESMVAAFQDPEIKFVFGGVRIKGQSFFATMQAHEFLSLVGTAAATLWWGFPSMCNGANLAFRKAVFFEVGGYENNFHIPSGDDEFLMHKVYRRYPRAICFVSHCNAIVSTAAVSARQFVHQRLRWAGKWNHNLSFWNIVLAVFIFFFQISVIALPVATLMGYIDLFTASLLMVTKIGIEFLLLKMVSKVLQVKWSWPAFLALQLIYPFYAVVIASVSNYFSFEWKGRTLKSFTVSTVKK